MGPVGCSCSRPADPKRDDSAGAQDDSADSASTDSDGDDSSTPDDCDKVTWFADHDGDGFGLDGEKVLACEPPDGSWVLVGSDCDDTSAAVNPDADEVCDPANVETNSRLATGLWPRAPSGRNRLTTR
jgi:hypothetical protein